MTPSFEASFNFSESTIHGTLAYPAVSLNNRFYFPSELARAHGKRLPIYDQHADLFELDPYTGKPLMRNGLPVPRQGPPPSPDGWMDVEYDPKTRMLVFSGQVSNPTLRQMIRDGQRKYVSLRADPQFGYAKIRDPTTGEEFHAPVGSDFISAATTDAPGLPLTMIAAESAVQSECSIACEIQVVGRPQPKIPDRFERERLLQAYLHYGTPGLSRQILKTYGLQNFPELRFLGGAVDLLKPLHAVAASAAGMGILVFPEQSSVEPFSFWHETAHCIESATGANACEDWCNHFAEVMTGEQQTKMALIGPFTEGTR